MVPYIEDNLSVRLNADCLALRSTHIERFGMYIYRPLTKLREGNVFTGVILSVILSTGIGYAWTQVPSAGVGMPGTSSLLGVCAGGWICIWIRRMKQCTIPKVINRIPFHLRSESVYMSHTFRHMKARFIYNWAVFGTSCNVWSHSVTVYSNERPNVATNCRRGKLWDRKKIPYLSINVLRS